jgi:Lysyl oxidase
MRLAGAPGLAAAIFVSATFASTAFAATPAATLDEGQSAFWPGAFVSDSRVDDPSACGVEGACFDYPIVVKAAHAHVLRVAIGSSEDSNGWDVRLLDPSGNVAATGSTWETDGVAQDYDAELFARRPAAGIWTMQVIAKNVHLGDFAARAAVDPPTFSSLSAPACTRREEQVVHIPRAIARQRIESIAVYVDGRFQRTVRGSRHALRVSLLGLPVEIAKVRLEIKTAQGRARLNRRVYTCAAARPPAVVDMPPDIAADPPWHLTFDQPPPMLVVESGNLTGIAGIHEPTMQAGDTPLYGCLPEETAEQGARRCLRFTSGFASLGPGPFTVYGESQTFASPTGGPLKQVITRSDGTSYSRDAGSYVFHPIHAHYHVLGIAEFHFFHVNPVDHTITDAGTVLKEGFCLGDIKIYDWHSFAQQEAHQIAGNCEPMQQPDGTYRFYEGISNGWEDSYKWATSGQFVDVGDDPDGYYLLRIDVNAQHKLLETTYDDNTAYAYMEIRGNNVRVIERGHGQGPWDPNKVAEDPVITR